MEKTDATYRNIAVHRYSGIACLQKRIWGKLGDREETQFGARWLPRPREGWSPKKGDLSERELQFSGRLQLSNEKEPQSCILEFA